MTRDELLELLRGDPEIQAAVKEAARAPVMTPDEAARLVTEAMTRAHPLQAKATDMLELIFLVEEAPEGGFTASALGESIYTEADSESELRQAVRDAVACHFDEGRGPRLIRLHFVREEVIPA